MVDPPYRVKNMMPGMVMIWPYSIATIPSGWHLCDGTAGTVDLRNSYLVCAGDSYNPMDAFGSDSQVHNFTTNGHKHNAISGMDVGPGDTWEPWTTTETDSGTTDPADNRPQSKAVNFIQKL
ncbi:unnamed protein product [marine sediment metagenome]|uniref:Phage tail collar domain-containing protein n=1 Tax=marine sediment metagenome TaxID=412755 RepID=X1QLA1_9ZZZZ